MPSEPQIDSYESIDRLGGADHLTVAYGPPESILGIVGANMLMIMVLKSCLILNTLRIMDVSVCIIINSAYIFVSRMLVRAFEPC